MRAGLVVTGVLGTGTVLVFALAGLVATLFPNGTLVASSWNGGFGGSWAKGGVAAPVPLPAPPDMPGNGVVIQRGEIGPDGTDGDLITQP
jgi:hypothetical protein